MKIPYCIISLMMPLFPLSGSPLLQIEPLPPTDATTAPIAWQESLNWDAIDPRFSLTESDTRATGKLVATPEGLHLRIEVQDLTHYNPFRGSGIWEGDSLQIGLDAKGDGSAGNDPDEARTMGPDDFSLAYALTDAGPIGWLYFAHDNARIAPGPLTGIPFSIARDDATETTLYELTFPWEALGVAPGLYPEIGLAIQINQSHPDREQIRLYQGRGADGRPRPGLFEKHALTPPPGTWVQSGITKAISWGVSDPSEVLVTLRDPDQRITAITARLGTEEAIWEPSSPSLDEGAIHRFLLKAIPASGTPDLEITAIDTAGSTIHQATHSLQSAPALLARFDEEVARRLESSPHPLFTRHLKSIRSLVHAEWGRLQLYLDDQPGEATDTLGFIESIALGLQHDAGDWEAYLDGRRTLVLAYVSPHDRSLQFYHFGLPRDWDPDRAYPLFFELHGAGNDNPASSVAFSTGIDASAPQLHGYTSPKTFAAIQRNGYWCMPFGRGNLGYRGIAETDIFEAYDDVHANFKIDEDRRYLYGFSMGGGGTWSVGLRTPDRWAAIAVLAGGLWREKENILLPRNAGDLPIWIWCGENDFLYPYMDVMRDELARSGKDAEIHTTPGIGHQYLMDVQERAINWLQQHTRKKPNHFFFAADQDSTPGIRGIHLQRNEAVSGLPTLECWIEDDTVRLQTEGAPTVEVHLGKDGLGLDRPITLIWNDKTVYTGEPQSLLLQNGQANPLDPTQRRR